ncbi:prepilin-type N-terminal cleavage/methylation domain-containing protein [Thalassotalea litorea]|uniref:Type II secretion system protein H n=1 Tax=Thalassotalea litorea TaxID=2020715 RepID=A0A5R9IJI6_9GAMM|nr:GspH/FimT family protein [Thalassotalea litorea]TLU61447.1 prepilin-type N-terminal cleavage/methylation domain-containing protein [Thalassotalea litorea]
MANKFNADHASFRSRHNDYRTSDFTFRPLSNGEKGLRLRPQTIALGFNLLELIITIAIISIIAAIATPSFVRSIESRHLVAATEDLYSSLQQARVESLSRSQSIFVNFTGLGSNDWAYGLNADSSCDPSISSNADAQACVLMIDNGDDSFIAADDNVLNRLQSSQYEQVILTLTSATSSSATTIFDPKRGFASAPLILTLSSPSNLSTQIMLTKLGNISICSPDLNDYQECK